MAFAFLKNAIVEFEEWSIVSIIRVGRAGEVWKLVCVLQNILPKALLFITKDLNSANLSSKFIL